MTASDLNDAAAEIAAEWRVMAEMAAALASATGTRTLTDRAVMEALFLHNRCLVNFLCGNWKGVHGTDDIRPKDFLGYDWWPADEAFERGLRGRLSVVNKHIAHLSWERVTDDTPVIWSVTLVSHQTHWGMHLFTEEAHRVNNPQAPAFAAARDFAQGALPRLPTDVAETTPIQAPPRT